jgi:hypothetical protein
MTEILLLAAAAFAAIAASAILIDTGLAEAAPNVGGKTFAAAQDELNEAGYTAVASASAVHEIPQSECLVVCQKTSNSWVFLALSCDATTEKFSSR